MFTYPDIRSQYKDHISGYSNLFRSSVHPYKRSFSHILRVDEAQDGRDKDKRTFAQIIRNHFLREDQPVEKRSSSSSFPRDQDEIDKANKGSRIWQKQNSDNNDVKRSFSNILRKDQQDTNDEKRSFSNILLKGTKASSDDKRSFSNILRKNLQEQNEEKRSFSNILRKYHHDIKDEKRSFSNIFRKDHLKDNGEKRSEIYSKLNTNIH